MAASSKRLKLCNFKLNVLLNITQAINENQNQQDLIGRYEEILKQDLNIGRIIVFKNNETQWDAILKKGFDGFNTDMIDIEKDLLQFEDITFVTNSPNPSLELIDIVIPIIYQEKPLAFVMIGDIDEDLEGVSPTIKHLNFIQTLSNVVIVAIENIRLHNESLKQEAMRKELELASKMQTMLIPNTEILPKNEHVIVEAFYHPHLDVGGDYYDLIQLDEEEIGFCIADVSGKGISAAILMSNFQANIRALFNERIPLGDMIGILNNRVMVNTQGEKFITLFLARYNYRTKVLEYVNAGHNPPIIYDVENKRMNFLNKGCVGMGMLDEIPIIKRGTLEISSRTKLFCYTDGLVELMDESGVEFGTKAIERLISNDHSMKDNLESIIDYHHILKGSTAIFDDITILAIDFLK